MCVYGYDMTTIREMRELSSAIEKHKNDTEQQKKDNMQKDCFICKNKETSVCKICKNKDMFEEAAEVTAAKKDGFASTLEKEMKQGE